jgi:hypothetical protein
VKILLGTHQLEILAGSELFTAELAHSFRALGHEVTLFTFFKGDLARTIEAQGIPVFDPGDAALLAQLGPDIVQTNHLPCAHYLRAVIPDAIRVHSMLGALPNLEAPPLDGDAYSLGLAVSEEVAERIGRSSFGRHVEVALFRNWFDDSAVATAEAREPHECLRVAVISNHLAVPLTDALAELEAAGSVTVDYFGTERKPVAINGTLLIQYDLVISIGRTVLLAAACGVPCIMADIHGSDGLLTVDNLDRVRTVNFSGRLNRRGITKAHLQDEIAKLPVQDFEDLRGKVAVQYSLKSRVEWLLSRYEELLASRSEDALKRRADPGLSAPSEGLVHAEVTAAVKQLRGQLEAAERQIAALRIRAASAPGESSGAPILARTRQFGIRLKNKLDRCRQQLNQWRRQPAGHAHDPQ